MTAAAGQMTLVIFSSFSITVSSFSPNPLLSLPPSPFLSFFFFFLPIISVETTCSDFLTLSSKYLFFPSVLKKMHKTDSNKSIHVQLTTHLKLEIVLSVLTKAAIFFYF